MANRGSGIEFAAFGRIWGCWLRGKKLSRFLCTGAIGLLFSSVVLADGLPDLAPIALQAPDPLTAPPNPVVSIDWGVTNQGVGPALGYQWDILYLSTQPALDSSATYISTYFEYSSLAAGESYWRTNQVQLPLIQSGQYYLILKTDYYNNVAESDENNNELAVPIHITIQPPDLAPVALLAPPPVTAPPYPSITLVWAVTNQGIGSAIGYPNWTDQVLFATNNSPDGAVWLGSWGETGPVPVGGSYWRTNTVQLPVTQSGTGNLFLKADAYDSLAELDNNNNLISVPIACTITPPDLVPVMSQIPGVITGPPNPTLSLAWGVTNCGIGAALGDWEDDVYLSTDPVPDWQDSRISYFSYHPPMPPGSSYWQTNTVQLPVVTNGTYYLIFRVDSYNNVFESDESNNVVVAPVIFNILPPDLVPLVPVTSLVLTSSPQPNLTLTWGVTNQGIGPAIGNWQWADIVYFSPDPVLDNSDQSMAYLSQTGPIPAGGSYWWTNTLSLPVVHSGTYYLLFKADTYDWLYESDETNNLVVAPI
ncbi:MAG: hypothetical protein NT154_26705, partial [Verrucomicrobia bacterium]|nr:hypothetical protein [Verrucomicrobiota bacterium]